MLQIAVMLPKARSPWGRSSSSGHESYFVKPKNKDPHDTPKRTANIGPSIGDASHSSRIRLIVFNICDEISVFSSCQQIDDVILIRL
jgi:hypothetical protein